MAEMDNLNSQYVALMNLMGQFTKANDMIESEQIKDNINKLEVLKKTTEILDDLSKKSDLRNYSLMEDIFTICKAYSDCQIAIEYYRETLLGNKIVSEKTISAIVKNVADKQVIFEKKKSDYHSKYGYEVTSIEDFSRAILACIRNTIGLIQKDIDRVINEAKEILKKEKSIELSADSEISLKQILPSEILIARYPLKKSSMDILKKIGINNIYQNLNLNLREQGNILVDASFEEIGDQIVDEFILAYIFKVIESFPLGTINIHIFGQNISYLYKRLANSFQNETVVEATKKIIQLHTEMKDLKKIRDVTCEDIFRKTSVEIPDLYAVYENDRTDPFNFIIIRDGLVDGSGYVSTEVLDVINMLSKPGDIGNKCGLRFLIIDNSRSYEKNITPNAKHVIDQIRHNCILHFDYASSNFSYSNETVEVLKIKGNIEQFIQEKSSQIANAINYKEKNYVSISDVATVKGQNNLENIMYIPVGKAGNTVVELPFSCKDENGTVAGQCIGYMAIGQSGSGKSSFFHSLVINGCLKYSPKELQFWLLDFKNGGASSKYSCSGLPHIKMIAENNKIDDALCLFQMVLEEMERRSKVFNKYFVDNIVDYNRIAETQRIEYFPRIVIAIDEVQEIFREDSASVLQKLISAISTRMRSAGMHFVMVAQNLSEGKSYMLKDAFLPSATGRICFRVAADIPRDSGFDEEFIQRKQEITDLKTGEAYVSFGRETIKKVKMAFTSSQEMGDKYFVEIRKKYPEYADLKPLVIGLKKRLAITSLQQGGANTYATVFENVKSHFGICTAILGEDSYRMSPLEVHFSQHENSSIMFLGSDKQIASSLCATVVFSLLRQNVEVHLFNGDRSKVQEEYEAVPHPFMYICQNIGKKTNMIKSHRLSELKDILKMLYIEYLQRQNMVQMADEEDPEFASVFLVINDLFAIESFVSNEMIENTSGNNEEQTEKTEGFGFDFDIFAHQASSAKQTSSQFRENMQNIMSTLVKNGWRYNMHVILAIKGDPSAWRNARISSEASSAILFNQTEYAEQFDNSYYLKEMLKNISNDGNAETMAVWSGKLKTYSKIRPFIYNLSDNYEKAEVDKLLMGE